MRLRIERSAGGDDDSGRVGGLAYDALVDRNWESVYRLAYHLCGGRVHDAQDLAQETFLKAIAARASFKAGTNLRAWLLRIASNAFLDQRRRKRPKLAGEALDLTAAMPAADRAEGQETMALLRAAIGELEETQRAVFLLRTQEEMSFRQIAETLATTEETARWHMMQARRRLMKRLEGRV